MLAVTLRRKFFGLYQEHNALSRGFQQGKHTMRVKNVGAHVAPWARYATAVPVIAYIALTMTGCGGKETQAPAPQAVEVSVVTVSPSDAPVTYEFVGQTGSSRQVEIRARVDGFLDNRLYTEGAMVKTNQVLFQMDRKPFEARLAAAKGALAQQQARLKTAEANLKRIKPLVAQNAVAQKDLDDAQGQRDAAAAAVESAKAEVEQATLDLGYTTIATPLIGLSSYARVQEGAYVNPQNSLLTYVSQVDPLWVDFSVSENEMLNFRRDVETGKVRSPGQEEFEVEIVLADGSVFPRKGRITFADATYNQQTGTFLIRATLPNPEGILKPGQFVRVRLLGAVRPKAIAVPQQAVLQGAKGHFVWIVDGEGKARIRDVEVGPWQGGNWFILAGLAPGDQVAVDGLARLTVGAPVKIAGEGASSPSRPLRQGPGQASSSKEAGEK